MHTWLLEILSESVFGTDEASVGHIAVSKSSFGSYTTFIRDFLELADRKSLLTGKKLHSILNDD